MSDLLSKLQAYSSSSSDDEDQQEKPQKIQIGKTQNNDNKSSTDSTLQQRNLLFTNNNLSINSNEKKQQTSLLNQITKPSNQAQTSSHPVQQSSQKPLLGKRSLLSKQKYEDDDEDEDFDLMKQARKQITTRNIQETIKQQQQKQLNNKKNQDQDQEEELQVKKLANIDPRTQELFKMLPPPKNQGDLSISNALRSNVEINYIQANSDHELNQNDQNEEDKDFDDVYHKKTLEIKSNDLVNKEQFYRDQLKKHSIRAFREQTLQRMRGTYDEVGNLAQKGKGKNHITSLASDHLDLITKIQDDKSSNLDEFRAKRARYGW